MRSFPIDQVDVSAAHAAGFDAQLDLPGPSAGDGQALQAQRFAGPVKAHGKHMGSLSSDHWIGLLVSSAGDLIKVRTTTGSTFLPSFLIARNSCANVPPMGRTKASPALSCSSRSGGGAKPRSVAELSNMLVEYAMGGT